MSSDGKEHRNAKGKESMLEIEAEAVQAQQPLSAKDEENVAASAEGSGLPFSKARCIALVLTVTTASFLNVCAHTQFLNSNTNLCKTLGVQASVIILPTIGHHLNIPDSRQQWIVSAYNLTFGCFLVCW